MLNRMRTDTRTSCPNLNDSVLNHPEESSKWVWLPTNDDQVDLSQLLIQIETAAQEMFQSETSKSLSGPLDSDAVFRRIANDMIKGKAELRNDSPTTT